jgi:hypothetical protein
MDVVLDTKPRRRRPSDPAPPITPLERLLGRELDAEVMDALDLMDNGKKPNMELLLEIGQSVGRSFVVATYPDPKYDLPEWRGG